MTSSPNTPFTEIDNALIPLSDGRQLAARIWLPGEALKIPSPAIFEYLPYRKRDGTAQRDDSTYTVFAAAGYAGVRVDISGTGESDGDFDDEYSPRELDECGYRFLPGHKIRLAISTAYWPMVMPPPERVTTTIMLGEHTCLTLPLYHGDNSIEIRA